MIQFLFLQFLQVYFLFYAKYTILCICLFDNLHSPLSLRPHVSYPAYLFPNLCAQDFIVYGAGEA